MQLQTLIHRSVSNSKIIRCVVIEMFVVRTLININIADGCYKYTRTENKAVYLTFVTQENTWQFHKFIYEVRTCWCVRNFNSSCKRLMYLRFCQYAYVKSKLESFADLIVRKTLANKSCKPKINIETLVNDTIKMKKVYSSSGC